MTHLDGGRRCLAIHHDGEGACILCGICGEWIRPSQMGEECPGHNPNDPRWSAPKNYGVLSSGDLT